MSLNWAEGERMSHVLLWVSCLSAGLGFLPHFVFTWSSSRRWPVIIKLCMQTTWFQFTTCFGMRRYWSERVCVALDRWSEQQNEDTCTQEQGKINRHSGVGTLLKKDLQQITELWGWRQTIIAIATIALCRCCSHPTNKWHTYTDHTLGQSHCYSYISVTFPS